jgi:hypothetical protein
LWREDVVWYPWLVSCRPIWSDVGPSMCIEGDLKPESPGFLYRGALQYARHTKCLDLPPGGQNTNRNFIH